MFLTKPELTAGSRPVLSPDETLLFVQDGVGLYEGSAKSYLRVPLTQAHMAPANTRLPTARKGMHI